MEEQQRLSNHDIASCNAFYPLKPELNAKNVSNKIKIEQTKAMLKNNDCMIEMKEKLHDSVSKTEELKVAIEQVIKNVFDNKNVKRIAVLTALFIGIQTLCYIEQSICVAFQTYYSSIN